MGSSGRHGWLTQQGESIFSCPIAGDSPEAMAGEDVAWYNGLLDKRRRWRAEEARNIEELLRGRP